MLRKELLEHFHKVEERVHVLGAGFATTFVLTVGVDHFLQQRRSELATNLLEWLHTLLLGLDVAIAMLLIVGIVLRVVGIRRPNVPLGRVARDKEISRHIVRWLAQSDVDTSGTYVQFCTEECIDQLTALNYRAFKDTEFAIELEKLAERNRDWVHRNARIFMLILDPLSDTKSVIGYSSMLPLTAEGIKSYLNGALKDADIPPSLVATDRKSAAAVLLFAIHLRPEYSFYGKTPSRNYSLFFLERVRHHLRELFPDTLEKIAYPPIYVQSELPSLRRRLHTYGFISTRRRSADGFEILVLQKPFQQRNAPGLI